MARWLCLVPSPSYYSIRQTCFSLSVGIDRHLHNIITAADFSLSASRIVVSFREEHLLHPATMQGMSLQSLKKHKALIPLYFCTGLGCFGALFYTARLAFKNPDVQWNRTGEISNEAYANKQYKFFSPNVDYSKIKSEAPKF